MKRQFLKLIKAALAPIALVIGLATFSPTAVFAQGHGHGFSGGHGGYSGRGGYGGYSGGRSYAAPRNYGGGRGYPGGFAGNYRGGYYGGRNNYYGGRGYYGGGYYGRGYYGGRGYYAPSVGVYPYAYAAPSCNPSGFYDEYGNWQVYPACAAPYGY